MSACTEVPLRRPLRRGEKPRPAPELLVSLVFRPAAERLVGPFVRLGVPPPAVVLANALAGLAAALAIATGDSLAAALLLQLKTLLDGADGHLARATGRVTLLGRYLDTEADLLVNAVLFGALAWATGRPLLALSAFLAVTFLLSADFNLAALRRELDGEESADPPPRGGRAERALAALYLALFGWQDRLFRRFAEARLERIAGPAPPAARRRAALAYHDLGTLAVLANAGLATQLAVLGTCLLLGSPEAYLWLAVGSVALLPLLQARRERLARRALAG
ncbi:MAG TPA: CDP-alcohol phosphatidyltransferase family protein [Gaiellaceae bacterium]|nr:CDP-alcohol phosphatidyltransferase family protein [Gaiellaceae bacterium]